MNQELVKSLYDKAVDICVEQSKDLPYPKAWTFEKTFLELIVKECVEHIRNRAMRAGGKCTTVGEEELWLAKDLEQHFGITNG